MQPAILTAAAIATLVITKAFEKTGKKLGEKVNDRQLPLLAGGNNLQAKSTVALSLLCCSS